MKTEFMEKITAPVKPGEFLFALDVIDAIGNGNRPGYRFIHSIGALKKYIDDEGKVGSLNSRVWAFTDMLREDRVVEWKKGTNVHSALFVAAAELPMTDRASFHPDDFYAKVREMLRNMHQMKSNACCRTDGERCRNKHIPSHNT